MKNATTNEKKFISQDDVEMKPKHDRPVIENGKSNKKIKHETNKQKVKFEDDIKKT